MDPGRWGFLGGITAAIAAGIYVLWGPSMPKKNKRKDQIPGLVNLGNTCFLNAVLQGMAACPSMLLWLGDFVDKHISGNITNFLAYSLMKILKVLNNQNLMDVDTHSPAEIISVLRTRRWVISDDEQDAHELFHVLTSTLDEETVHYPPVISLLDVKKLEESSDSSEPVFAVNRSQKTLPKLPGRRLDLPFRGLLASQLKCKKCGFKCPVKYDTFDSLSLAIPSNQWVSNFVKIPGRVLNPQSDWEKEGTLTLQHCLQHFIMSELVKEVECESCAKMLSTKDLRESCTKTTFLKQLTIGKLPECLCIHLQRTVWLNNGMPMKRYEHVQFPEYLRMDEFVHRKRRMSSEESPFGCNRLVGGSNVLADRYSTLDRECKPFSEPINLFATLKLQSPTKSLYTKLPPPPPTSDNNNVTKITSLVGDSQLKSCQPDYIYRLNSILVHLGDVFSGHFITYRRGPQENKSACTWYYTSDTIVRKASLEEVLRADAYMLFYEKLTKDKASCLEEEVKKQWMSL